MAKTRLKNVDFAAELAAEREKAHAEISAEREKIARSKERIKSILSGLQERENEYYMSLIRERKISIEDLQSALELYDKTQQELPAETTETDEETPNTATFTGGITNDEEN